MKLFLPKTCKFIFETRLWWLIAFVLSVWLCAASIHNIWMKWQRNPTTITLADKQFVPISSIPFPTVTICPETKAKNLKLNITAAFHALSGFGNLSAIEFIQMETLVHLCQFYFPENVDFENRMADQSIYFHIQDIALTINETLFNCHWKGKKDSCLRLFTPVLTDEGVCFTFNALNSHEIFTERMAPEMMRIKTNPNVTHWNIETGYENGIINGTTYPIRVFNAKQSAALIAVAQISSEDLEFICRGPVQGFRIFLTTPGESLRSTKHPIKISLSEYAEILIKPTLYITSPGLRRYDPNERQCFFDSERQLSFYRNYSQEKCETECLANFTRIECGCVKFSMPRDRETKICGAASLKCYQNAEEKLFGEDVIDGLTDEAAKSFRTQCNCLPSCISIAYDHEVHRVKFDWISLLNSYKAFDKQDEGMQPSCVSIAFRDHHVVTLKRSELYTYIDFLAICGGLLSLFLGVSTFSVIKFIYHSMIRLNWTIRQWKSNNNAVAPRAVV